MRPEGETGVQTHFTAYLEWLKTSHRVAALVTPFAEPAWQVYPIFALRSAITPLNGAASVKWYRHWHEVFLERALKKRLAVVDRCVVLAQCPLSAVAALRS